MRAVPPEADIDRVRAAYERIHGRLWRAVLAWSGSTDVADDAVAEAFAQVLRRGDEVNDPEAWAWRAAFRIAAGELSRRREAGLVADVPEVATAGDGGWLPPLAWDLVVALGRLSDQQRACVALRDVGGLDIAEVAAALGTSAGTVRVQHLKGRRRLRELLGGDDG